MKRRTFLQLLGLGAIAPAAAANAFRAPLPIDATGAAMISDLERLDEVNRMLTKVWGVADPCHTHVLINGYVETVDGLVVIQNGRITSYADGRPLDGAAFGVLLSKGDGR